MGEYRWEYSPLARGGNFVWARAIDPVLRMFGNDLLEALRRIRGVVQIAVLAAILVLPLAFLFSPSRILAISGLLFDIAGVLRVFLLEETSDELGGFEPNEYGNLPSVAMRELVMPEASGPYDADSDPVSLFYYRKRGVLFLCIGFFLQAIGNLLS